MQNFNFTSSRHAKKTNVKFPFSFHALIATWFYTGKSTIAPGTVGSIASYPLYLFIINSAQSTAAAEKFFLLLSIFLLMLGTWAVGKFQKQIKVHDHQCIVIDEVLGMMVVFALSMGSAAKIAFWLDNKFHITFPPKQMAFFIGFIVFRYFDIRKPFFIRSLDRMLRKPIGVMLDDVVAALFSAGVIYIISLILRSIS